MENRISNRNFFTESATQVAHNLIGKFIYCKGNGEEYQIIKTEAYYHNEKDYSGKYFCYGVNKKTGENSKTYATLPLFRDPGTWCIYGGQLLLSVKNSEYSDNVLIKEIKASNGKKYTTDGIAKSLRLYQKCSDTNYWNFHGLDSLSKESTLYLIEKDKMQNINPKSKERKNINNDQAYQFYIDGE